MDGRSSLVSELDARRVLDLATRDRRAAGQALAELSLEDQVGLVCQAPVGRRASLLELTPEPERVVPLIPVAELCFTARAVGLADASWLLEHATPEQIVACVDLDAWSGLTPDQAAMGEWLATLAEAGPETLLRAAQSLDAEMMVLYLREHAEVYLDPADDEWEPPDGCQTIDSQFHFRARTANDDLAPLVALLHALFRDDYWLYFRLMQGVIWEMESDLEEWSLRWRTGRLGDLGFPSWDEAMRIYGYVRPENRADIPDNVDPLAVSEWMLPVWIESLPAAADSPHAIFRAAADLDDGERRAFFYAFVALANKVAVADAMPLSDVETLPNAIEKVAVVASHGLEYIAQECSLTLPDVLRRLTLERLFRVGASIDPESSRP